jgi:PAS domain S-box-containing protein
MSSVPIRSTPHWALALAGTALAYALAGWAALWLAIPPGHASPLFPASGIALACVLTFGWRVLPGVALASFAVNAMLGPQRGLTTAESLALATCIAVGATLQAAVGAALIRRFVRPPVTLSEPRDVLVFCGLGAIASCLTSSSIAVAALFLLQAQPPSTLLFTWWIWGTGDTLGVLVAAPVVLSFIGWPRSEWRPRRLTVGLTLLLATALMAYSIKTVDRWEEARIHSAFERDAVHMATLLESRLRVPFHAMEAMRGMFLASQEVTRDEHARAAAAWMVPGNHLRSMGWADIVRRPDLPRYLAAVRASDLPGFTFFERADIPEEHGANDELLAPIRFIEPSAGNLLKLGLNARSAEVTRQAMDQAIRTDTPTATAGFPLVGDISNRTSVVIFRAVYKGTPATAQARADTVTGIVFVALPLDEVLETFPKAQPPNLDLCLIDTDPSATQRRLAGTVGCDEPHPSHMLYEKSLPFADRVWTIRVIASRADLPDARASNALLFSMIGVATAVMLAALLLTVTGRALRIETAVNDRTLALQREIGERQRTEAELRESEQRFRNILNNVPIGVVYTDLRGNIKQLNPRFCELTGYDASEAIEMNLSRIHHPEDRLDDLELTRQLIHGEIPIYRRQGRYITRDGRLVRVQSTVTLLRDPQGEPYRIVGVVEDIAEHLRLADAERARSVAEAANLAKSEFLSRMSHELRTPLNAMLGFAQLLELDTQHPLPPSHQPWVAQIQSAGWHLLDMINDVLDLSRIESGTLNLQTHTLDLREILASTLALVERDAQQRGIAITQDGPEDGLRVTGDATRVKQILTNVLSNAVKYNSDGGRIRIVTRPTPDDAVEVVVSDTGLGMTGDQLAQLFQPFNRLGRERSSLEGTGIGLVVSQRLAELMGGSLTARSTAGQGSSFILRLPRAIALISQESSVNTSTSVAPEYHQRIVHYVEDNETNVEVMRGVLSRRPQVRLDVSLAGLEGLAAIRSVRPDLILLDMHLPDIDGLELLRHLKEDPTTADIPVVAVSADALAAQIKAALDAGAQQYLTKPISVSELLAVIDAVLDQAETRYG